MEVRHAQRALGTGASVWQRACSSSGGEQHFELAAPGPTEGPDAATTPGLTSGKEPLRHWRWWKRTKKRKREDLWWTRMSKRGAAIYS